MCGSSPHYSNWQARRQARKAAKKEFILEVLSIVFNRKVEDPKSVKTDMKAMKSNIKAAKTEYKASKRSGVPSAVSTQTTLPTYNEVTKGAGLEVREKETW